MFELGLLVNVMRLYNGHRSVYVRVTVGPRSWWVQRWDVARTTGHRFLSRDGLMGWTWGVRRPTATTGG